jgi:HlyD family secretion protein
VLATNYTHLRQVAELKSNVKQATMALERARSKANANIAQARAEVRAREAQYVEDKERLRRVESEIAKAKMYAPIDGMVLYASSVSNDWDDDDPRIQVGVEIRERREIVYLPTADSYDVDIRVPEVSLNKIRPGQPARILVDALPGTVLSGKVLSISPLPDSRSRFLNPNLKLYNAAIRLDPADAELRNGMSCQAEIVIGTFPDALHVPMQTVVQLNGQPTLYLVNGQTTTPVPVELGLDNNRVVQVLSGVEEGQIVALTPPLAPAQTDPLVPPDEPAAPEPEEEQPAQETATTANQMPVVKTSL